MSEKKKRKALNTTSIGIGQTVHVQRNGEAASQMIQAYTGRVYNSAGNEIMIKKRSLEKISNYKINPDHADKNLKQQAGFAAEQVEEARRNKEAIRSGDKKRARTTDDVGKVNDTVNDIVLVDENGNVIHNSGVQVKFYGIGKDGNYLVIDEFVNNETWDRYEQILVPKDQYDGAIEYADKKAAECRQNAQRYREQGKTDKANEQLKKAERFEKVKNRLRKSKLTYDEAMEARKNTEKFVAKEVAGDCIKAGMESMKYAAIVGGVVAVAQNTVAVFNGEKNVGDAALDSINTTADSAFTGFFVGTAGSALKSLMHVSKNELVRRLGTTTAPTAIVTGVIDISKSLISFARGEIDTLGLFEQLGEKGVCSIASGIGAGLGGSLGSLLGPAGTVIGGIAGGMVSYAVCSAIYNSAVGIINDARYARDRRLQVEALCDEAIQKMRIYRCALEGYSRQRTNELRRCFNDFFNNVDKCAKAGSIEEVFREFNTLDKTFGFLTRFKDFEEFDSFMSDSTTILTF